jgi:hypothetical protein
VPFFDDMDAIIFLAPISCFDQVLAEDDTVNRLVRLFVLLFLLRIDTRLSGGLCSSLESHRLKPTAEENEPGPIPEQVRHPQAKTCRGNTISRLRRLVRRPTKRL